MVEPIRVGTYFTDGEALYCVVVADRNGVMLEDCSGMEEWLALSYEDFAAKELSRVEPAHPRTLKPAA